MMKYSKKIKQEEINKVIGTFKKFYMLFFYINNLTHSIYFGKVRYCRK
jgi:hypothetical protein